MKSVSCDSGCSEMPQELWIELTSKCPFRCLFCSRKLLRGDGEHMPFELYQQLVSELVEPQVIRLNYSGESVHYPHLIEAIRSAKNSGARVELVSAFSSIKLRLIEPLVASGLDELCISIHTTDPKQYQALYGFGTYSGLVERFQLLREAQRKLGREELVVTFALVAMQRNLGELHRVTALAEKFGVSRLDVHPVIRRDPIEETFPDELDSMGRLRASFLRRLADQAQVAGRNYPSVQIGYSTPETDACDSVLGYTARPFPGRLPNGAVITDCGQSPLRTAHILANGDVVSCEVRDQLPLGNLHQESFRNIWRGERYQIFRERFKSGKDAKCVACSYKHAQFPLVVKPAQENVGSPDAGQDSHAGAEVAKRWIARTFALGLDITLRAAEFAGSMLPPIRSGRTTAKDLEIMRPGISIIIPERDSPALLTECIEALEASLALLAEPSDIVVVVNGSSSEDYAKLRDTYPAIQWLFESNWLDFSSAIAHGLEQVKHSWVLLLNNDMMLEPNALVELCRYRAPQLFSLACQIELVNQSRRREETGLTALAPEHGLAGLHDVTPDGWVRRNLYAGGGASLFQRDLLRQMVTRSRLYRAFYWEDVDWGMRAQALGFQNLFVPTALAHHHHQATVARFFSAERIKALFEGNALLNGLAQGWYKAPLKRRSVEVAKHRYLFASPTRLAALVRSRFEFARSRIGVELNERDSCFYQPEPPVPGDTRPWLIVVSPFSLWPMGHGSAVRLMHISQRLTEHYRLVLVCDEGWNHSEQTIERLSHFSAIHLVTRPRNQDHPDSNSGRLNRMRSHARLALRTQLARAIQVYQPAIVQLEHEEVSDLVSLKTRRNNSRWFITLHDVLSGPRHADRRLRRNLDKCDGVFVCSTEDQAVLARPSVLIENGASLEQFRETRESSGESLVFVGPFRYRPNRNGIEWFLHNVWDGLLQRYPDLKLNVLGGDEALEHINRVPFQQSGISLVPYTENVGSYLASSSVVINPLRNIAGSCLKTIEALAANRICVSTTDAARGLTQAGFPGLLIADTVTQWHNTIVRALDDPTWRRAKEQTPDAMIAPFDWRDRANQQLEAYRA